MELNQNQRGFVNGAFTDFSGNRCSIQKSSLATQDCIWLGIDDADPSIMQSDADKLGLTIDPTEGTTWLKYPIPKQVLLNTYMHLNQKQVAQLLPILQKFVETGEI